MLKIPIADPEMKGLQAEIIQSPVVEKMFIGATL